MKKEKALTKLINNFEKDLDYINPQNIFPPNGEKIGKGRQLDKYYLTIDCFKSFAMMSGTSKGKEVRLYFLGCEKRLKQLLSNDTDKLVKERIVNAIVSDQVIDLKPKFEEWFYEMLYRKRGNGWENRSTKERPPCVGTWTNNVVYDQMFGGEQDWGVKAKLLESEPKINGRRKNPLHTHFDNDFGINYLQ